MSALYLLIPASLIAVAFAWRALRAANREHVRKFLRDYRVATGTRP